ncbi:uncharacterized protein C2orf16-like isoform X1 [Anolis carolinensis]|uniref:uncharacterized protein C2orf16-like isoform X1 n=2 Tax=Anolis carolinensis TaxID=28377 RepID=UPI002F2B1EF6
MVKDVPGGSEEPRVSMQAGPSEKESSEKESLEMGISEKGSSEKEPSEKELSEKRPSEKRHSEKRPSEKRHSEKGPSEKWPSEKEYSEKRHSEKRPSEKEYSEKGPSEKWYSEKRHSEKGPSEKGPSEKWYSEKRHSEKGPSEKGPSEKGPSQKEYSEKGPSEKDSAAVQAPSEGKLTARSGSLGSRAPSGSPAVRIMTEVEPTPRSGSLGRQDPSEATPFQQAGPPVSRATLQVRSIPAVPLLTYGLSELRPMHQLVVPVSRGPSMLRAFPHGAPGRNDPSEFPMQQGYPLSRGPSEMRPLQQSGFPLNRGPSEMRPLLKTGPLEHGPTPSKLIPFKPVKTSSRGFFTLKNAIEIANESCNSTIGLLLVCIILMILVSIMNMQVHRLLENSGELKSMINLQVVILAELLMDLQFGKAYNCSICEVPWVQWGDNCYLFRHRAMSWSWSNGFCLDEKSSLVVVNGSEEMNFLRYESKKHFNRRKHSNFLKFWIGLKYDTDVNKWMWADGSPFNLKNDTELGQGGCAYVQNGNLGSQPCKKAAFIICKAKTLFG